MTRATLRLVGRGLFAGLAVLLALNLYWIGRNWTALRAVATPTGSVAPDFTVKLLHGGETRLSDAAGHPLVLAFWATWCGPCKTELPSLDRLYRRFSPDGTRFLAVNIEDLSLREKVDEYARTSGLTMPVAIDGGLLANRYHVDAIPHLVILDAHGKVSEVLDGVHEEGEVARSIQHAAEASGAH